MLTPTDTLNLTPTAQEGAEQEKIKTDAVYSFPNPKRKHACLAADSGCKAAKGSGSETT